MLSGLRSNRNFIANLFVKDSLKEVMANNNQYATPRWKLIQN